MLSCDTLAIGKELFVKKENLFGKNSDRPLGEAQPLLFFQGENHKAGELLKCTHLTITQVEETYAVMGCKPFWIWGFETGINEHGLAIGNEAQGSRCEGEKVEGMLGMDMVRIALERAINAQEAMHIIAELLKEYGQNANANMLFDRRYENSFLLVDREEIWLMETAGREWVAKKIYDWAAISNCYVIGKDYDMASPSVESYAREHRLLGPNEDFDFSRAYTTMTVRQTNSIPRWRRLCNLIEECAADGSVDRSHVKRIFRDHFEGEINAPRTGGCCGVFYSVCMHAMTWDATQTASGFLCSYDETLGNICRYAPSLPCCSVYIPIYWTEQELPVALCKGGELYDGTSLWWATERLAMAVSIDEERFGSDVRGKLAALEESFEKSASVAEDKAKALFTDDKKVEGRKLLQEVMEQFVEEMLETVTLLTDEICEAVVLDGGAYGPRKEFLEEYSHRVKMPLY